MKNKKNSGGGSHSLLNLLAMILVFVSAVVIIINWVLGQFDLSAGKFNDIVGWLVKICYLIGLFFLALYAYGYVTSHSGSKRKTWTLIYIISIIILFVFLFLGWF